MFFKIIKSARGGLFLTAFLQVFLVAISTACLARGFYLGAFVSGFGISFFWSGNVKRAAFGGMPDRLIYATGAAFGSASGLWLTMILAKFAG